MNTIDKVDGRRLANDIHVELIAMWHSIVDNGWLPPVLVSEEDYNNAKNNKNDIPMALDGYIGFNSFGGKWYAGYRRDSQGKRDYWKEHYNNIMKQAPKLKGIVFANLSYSDLPIPNNSVIYCDPPYANTTKYKDDFNHDTFWQWCRDKHKEGHTIFVSEYNAPDDFKCVWEMQVTNSMHQTKHI